MEKAKIFKVIIDGFQSHKHTEVDFSNFSVIIGPTNAGKSAITRAMKWCLLNEVEDPSFINKDSEFAEVSVYFTNGKVVTRKRGKNLNYYKFGDTVLESFGAGPVEAVLEYHGMRNVNLFGDSKSLNFRDQHSPPFFLAESPANKAAMIGGLAKTEVIDIAIGEIVKDIRTSKAQLKALKAEQKENNEKLKDFSIIPSIEHDLEEIIATNDRTDLLLEKMQNILDIKNRYSEYSARLKSIYEKIKIAPEVSIASEKMQLISERVDFLNKVSLSKLSLFELSEKFSTTSKFLETVTLSAVEEASAIIARIDAVMQRVILANQSLAVLSDSAQKHRKQAALLALAGEVDKAYGDVVKLVDSNRYVTMAVEVVGRLQNEVSRETKGSLIISQLESQKASLEAELNTIIEENPVCPVCGNNMKEGCIDG